MWLLNTARAELHFFPDPSAVVGGYAILSHRWEGDEQSFQDLQRIMRRCRHSGENPRDHVSVKIRECCILAERYGYLWLWADSCCINKESSTELSEAVNSMYSWYAWSEVCFAYLSDVPSNCKLYAENSEFRRSEWHKRGWTLQELIAPSTVIFLSGGWKVLGNRHQLADLLRSITGIPQDILRGVSTPSNYGIYVRMSWASERSTTRVEDEAYCLLGLFGVSMPTIYGEGRRAFQRLQLEIMTSSVDTSLFAWGPVMSRDDQEHEVPFDDHTSSTQDARQFLLAPSPREYSRTQTAYYIPSLSSPIQPYTQYQRDRASAKGDLHEASSWHSSPFAQSQLPRWSLTNYGVECHFPVIELNQDVLVALLLCEMKDEHLGLLLHRSGSLVQDGKRGLYCTKSAFVARTGKNAGGRYGYRMISLGKDLTDLHILGRAVQAEWRTIHIMPYPSVEDMPIIASHGRLAVNRVPEVPFCLPHWLTTRFATLGFSIDSPQKALPMCISMAHWERGSLQFRLRFGLCSGDNRPLVQWAKVEVAAEDIPGQPFFPPEEDAFVHDCSKHHIDASRVQSWDFGSENKTVRLTCMPSLSPHRMVRVDDTELTTIDFHIELLGGVYEMLLRSANVRIPTAEEMMSMRGPSRILPAKSEGRSLFRTSRSRGTSAGLASADSRRETRRAPGPSQRPSTLRAAFAALTNVFRGCTHRSTSSTHHSVRVTRQPAFEVPRTTVGKEKVSVTSSQSTPETLDDVHIPPTTDATPYIASNDSGAVIGS